MADEPQEKPKIIVDTDWKAQVEAEKEAFRRLQEQQRGERTRSGQVPLPPATFAFFVSTLSTQALLALGHLQDPAQGDAERDLEQARYLIDVLQMLEEKTRGNLTPEEQRMLENVLHDLRLAYVEAK
jgi:hypothetical protein